LVEAQKREWEWNLKGTAGTARLVFPDVPADGVRVEDLHAQPKADPIQIEHGIPPVYAGQHYAILFRARAAQPRTLWAGVSSAYSPWSTLGVYTQVPLTTEWKEYRLNFDAPRSDSNPRIYFDVGNDAIPVEVAGVDPTDK